MTTWSSDDNWKSSEEIVAAIDRSLSISLSISLFFFFFNFEVTPMSHSWPALGVLYSHLSLCSSKLAPSMGCAVFVVRTGKEVNVEIGWLSTGYLRISK